MSTTNSNVIVNGKTVPNAQVSVNQDHSTADAKGKFAITTSLDAGDNFLNIYAVDDKGNFAETEIKVTNQNF